MPITGNYYLTDACLCPGMAKMVIGTNRGRLMLFNAKIKEPILDEYSPINEHIETDHIVKVAHEVQK